MTQPTIDQIIVWAKAAGEILRDGYGRRHQIDMKGDINLVTEVDHQSEDYLVGQIHTAYPDHTIFTEESGELHAGNSHCWYIDPLDGTTNYAHSVPIFSVSIAYAEGGKIRLAVVYDPMRDECFSAELGKGATLNGEAIAVSSVNTLLRALLVTGFPYDLRIGEKNLVAFAHFTRRSQGVRRMGSAALDLCAIAAGRMDGYWEQTLEAWDLAAGALIVEEAGGIVSTLLGEAEYLRPPYAILAANPQIHPQMVSEFQKIVE